MSPMAETPTFAQRLVAWKGDRSAREAADAIGIPLSTFHRYIYGTRKPGALALAEIERRMAAKPEVKRKCD